MSATRDALTTAAVVGTGQRPVHLDSLPSGVIATSERPETALLDALAQLATIRRSQVDAGQPPQAPAPPADDERLPEAPPAFTATLLRVLNEPTPLNRRLVAEALAHLAHFRWRLPYRVLVPVLFLAHTDAAIAKAAAPVLGARGAWLATQNPGWAEALASAAARPAEPVRPWTHDLTEVAVTTLTPLKPDDAKAFLATLPTPWNDRFALAYTHWLREHAVAKKHPVPQPAWHAFALQVHVDAAIGFTGMFRDLAESTALSPRERAHARAVATALVLRTALYTDLAS